MKSCVESNVIPGCTIGAGPEPMNTAVRQHIAGRCEWVPGSWAAPTPRKDSGLVFLHML